MGASEQVTKGVGASRLGACQGRSDLLDQSRHANIAGPRIRNTRSLNLVAER